jgi:hypothetical protein
MLTRSRAAEVVDPERIESLNTAPPPGGEEETRVGEQSLLDALRRSGADDGDDASGESTRIGTNGPALEELRRASVPEASTSKIQAFDLELVLALKRSIKDDPTGPDPVSGERRKILEAARLRAGAAEERDAEDLENLDVVSEVTIDVPDGAPAATPLAARAPLPPDATPRQSGRLVLPIAAGLVVMASVAAAARFLLVH